MTSVPIFSQLLLSVHSSRTTAAPVLRPDMGQFNSGIGIGGQFQSQNWNCLFFLNGTGIDKFGIEVCYKKINKSTN